MKASVKRGICLALVLVTVLCLTACSGVPGRYKIDRVESEGVVMEGETLQSFLSMAGMSADDMYIELRDDGTGTMCVFEETMEIRYADGQIWTEDAPDEKISFDVSGGKLTIEMEGTKMVFKK